MIDENEKHCTIIEVTCPYETSQEYLMQRRIEKERKYHSLIRDELWQVKCNSGEVIAITIGAMGTILEDSYKAIKKLGLANHCNALQMISMNSSVILLNNHFNTGDFYKRGKHKSSKPTNSKH